MQVNTSNTCFRRYTRTAMAAVLILLAHPAAGFQGASIRQLHSVFSDAISVKDVIDYANGVDASVAQRRAFLELHDAYENSFKVLQSIDMKRFARGPLRNAARYEGSQYEAIQPKIVAARRIRKRIRQLDDQFFRDCEAICTDDQIRLLQKLARIRECERILTNSSARSISPYPLIDLVAMEPEFFLLESESPGIDELVRQYEIRSVSSLRNAIKSLEEDWLKRSRALDEAGLFREVMSGSNVPKEVGQKYVQIAKANSDNSVRAIIRHLELNSQFLRSPLWVPRQSPLRAIRYTYLSRLYRDLKESIEHTRMIDSWLEVIDSDLEGNSESAEEEAHDFLASLLGQCDRLLMNTEQKILVHLKKTPTDARNFSLRTTDVGDDIDDCNEQIQILRKRAEEYLQASMPHVLELARTRKPGDGGSGTGQAANVPPSQSGDSDVLPAPFIHLPPIDRRELDRYITMLGILPEMETVYEVSHKDYLVDVDAMHAAVRDVSREETPEGSVMPVGDWIAAHDKYSGLLAKRDDRLIEELAALSEDRGDQLSRVKLVRAITRNNPKYPPVNTAAESKINLLELLLNEEARESDIPNTALSTVFERTAGKLIVLFETRSRIFSKSGHVLAQFRIETDETARDQLLQNLDHLKNQKDLLNREIIELQHLILRQVEQSEGGSGRADTIRFRGYMEAYREYLQPIERLTTMFTQLLKDDRLGAESRVQVAECRGDFMEALKVRVDELAIAMRRWEGMSLSSDEQSPPDMGEYEHWLDARTRIDAIEQLCQRTLVDVIEIFDGDDITMFPSLHAAKQLLFDES